MRRMRRAASTMETIAAIAAPTGTSAQIELIFQVERAQVSAAAGAL